MAFLRGYQSAPAKMVASVSDCKTTMAKELVQLFRHIDYDETVCTLKQPYAVPIEDFPIIKISKWFDLDTSKCFTESRKLKFNPL